MIDTAENLVDPVLDREVRLTENEHATDNG